MSDKKFTKDNLNQYLKELAKEFRRRNGKNVSAEIILIGGAAVLINYGFREMTYDMDAIINASASMKDTINYVGDKNDLPNGWLNTDFMNTDSYSPKIIQYSQYYRTYSNVVSLRTVTAEYLVAMKLKSGRKYKYDRSDIIGILKEQENNGKPLSLDMIKKAVTDLYGSYDVITNEMKQFIEDAIADSNYAEQYIKVRKAETENKANLTEFINENPDAVINGDNINELIDILKNRNE